MTALDYLDRWRADGAISGAQYAALSAIVRRERFSLSLELNALLYLGVLAFVAGLGLTIYEQFARLGDAAIVVPLLAVFAGCLYSCFTRSLPYSPAPVEQPGFAFDYVLYLGCLVFGVWLGYLEYRFQLLRGDWDFYLLASAFLYAALAYRFDNRFVLSLSLSTLAGFFGVRATMLGFHLGGTLRGDALGYAVLIAAAGAWTHRSGIKRHFLETYLHVAANAALAALVSGVLAGDRRTLWLMLLLLACGAIIDRGVRARRFVFVSYGVIYGYVGLSARVLGFAPGLSSVFLYFVVSGTIVIGSLALLSRRFHRDS